MNRHVETTWLERPQPVHMRREDETVSDVSEKPRYIDGPDLSGLSNREEGN